MKEEKKGKTEEVKDEEIKESVTSETEKSTDEEKTETKVEEVEPKVDETASVEQKNKEEKGLTKTAKIAIGAAVGAVAAVAAIVIPTGVVLSQNSLEDRDKIFIDYNVDGTESEHLEIEKETRIADLKLKPIEGYVFVGWFKDEACTQPYAQDDIITPESTIYAKYNPATYLVAFPTSQYFVIDEEPRLVNYGDEISFAITYDEAYTESATKVVVKANGKVLPQNEEGRYVLSGIKENTIITVDGVEINKYTATINIDGQVKTYIVEYGQNLSEIENMDLNEENTIGFFTSEEFTRENLYDVGLPISSDLNLYTKKATPEVFDFYEYAGDNTEYRAVIKEDTSEAVVPLKYNGGSIRSISNNSNIIQSVCLSANVSEVEDSAFADCVQLNSINLSNISRIENSAFEGCVQLSSINLNNILRIENSAFEGCSNLDVDFTSLKYLKEIEAAAFAMSGVTEVKFFENCTIEIGVNAFNSCEKLESVYLGKNVSVEYGSFANCPKLSYIYLNSDNINTRYIKEGDNSSDDFYAFADSCFEVEGGATLVVGPDVTVLNLGNTIGSNQYMEGSPALITKLIFEADNSNNTISIKNGLYEYYNYFSTVFIDEMVCDSQRVLNAFLSGSYIIGVDNKLYVNKNLEGAEDISSNLSGHNNFALTLQEESDREGYFQYNFERKA